MKSGEVKRFNALCKRYERSFSFCARAINEGNKQKNSLIKKKNAEYFLKSIKVNRLKNHLH